jgi:hypothetical protein
MGHFARINNGIVQEVIVAEPDVINAGTFGPPEWWVQTSYNTRGGVHYDPVTNQPDGGIPLRKNYAGIGDTYDPVRDAFIPKKIYPSWVLNENTCLWEPPIPQPKSSEGMMSVWNEDTVSWDEVPLPIVSE